MKNQMDQEREILIDRVRDEIHRFLVTGELEPVVELLSFVKDENLLWFLNEKEWSNYPAIKEVADKNLF